MTDRVKLATWIVVLIVCLVFWAAIVVTLTRI
jgi:hypothetical protein